ncbi:hypothetical protein PENNAL_c0076G09647 [Penicillium nalgiovense]|uniref:Uncharacterized protein n=1 Tax=Penicillium nalgiovense TaxID=60175 RepID=A0A1V6XHQ4_PENNA|nr:hypothetical protein PENNAL_c0076G09647 [Penicillium nalgiovense]
MRGRSWDLSGTLDNAPVVDWWIVWPWLERYPGLVCYIFDTCSSVSAVFESYAGAEFMGASGWDTNVPAAHNTFFARALINTLKDMRDENSTLATVKPHTESATIGNQDRCSGRPTQAAARSHMRVLLGVNIDDMSDPRTLDINFWKQWSPQVPRVQPVYTGSLFGLFSIAIEMWAMLSDDPAYTYINQHIGRTTAN